MSINETVAMVAVAGDQWDRGPWRDGDGPPGFWPIFPIFWLLVIAAIITTIIVVNRRRTAAAPRHAGEAKLAERYAAGEIDENEYRARRAVLREQPDKPDKPGKQG